MSIGTGIVIFSIIFYLAINEAANIIARALRANKRIITESIETIIEEKK